MWPETTLLLPVWPRDAERLDTTGRKEGRGQSKAVNQQYSFLVGSRCSQDGLKACAIPSLHVCSPLALLSGDSPVRNKMAATNLVVPTWVSLVWRGKANLWPNFCGHKSPVWAMCPARETGMTFPLPESLLFPQKKLGHCAQQWGGNEDRAGKAQSFPRRLGDASPTVEQQLGRRRELKHWTSPPKERFF